MKIKIIFASLAALAAGAIFVAAQDVGGKIVKEQGKPKMAVIDFRGAGDAQKFMTVFNTTLWD
jgi:hypothetical protein